MISEEKFVNIASHLSEMARLQPAVMAVVFPQGRDNAGRRAYTHLTFSQLEHESNHIAHSLGEIGISGGIRTVLMVTPSLDFIALVFALFKAGAVPVLIDPGMGVKNMGKCIREAQPQAFIGVGKAHLARLMLGWGRNTIKIKVTVGKKWGWSGYTLKGLKNTSEDTRINYTKEAGKADETAAILFTSGSTGVPKGAIYTHHTFDQQVKVLRKLYGIQPGEIDLPTFPLFALFDPALGMTSVIPDMDPTRPAKADPRMIIEIINDFGVTNMFGSPALINRLSRFGQKYKIKIPSLKRAISAGAPVPASTLKRFAEMLDDHARIFTPYGATEALPVCSLDHKTILNETCRQTEEGRGVCVGKPVEGITLKIIKISDDPLPKWGDDLVLEKGKIGEVIVKGGVVTREYINRPKSTALAKIYEENDAGFYHRMGDVGYLDEKGRLWYCGRKTQRLGLASKTLFTIQCEGICNTHPSVSRSALVGITYKRQLSPVICIEPEEGTSKKDYQAIEKELRELLKKYDHTKDIALFLFHPGFPVDIRHNAKIFREKIAVWAQKKLTGSA